jgi:holo-[acyl-carrier protein] synthase
MSEMTGMRIVTHGLDLVEIGRIAQMLRDHGERFVRRCFTDVESDYAEASPKRRDERYAVRFAAKEAVLKALGTGWRNGISWRDIGVIHEPSGQPRIVLQGRCAKIARELGIVQWHVSLTHTDHLAAASVIGYGTE